MCTLHALEFEVSTPQTQSSKFWRPPEGLAVNVCNASLCASGTLHPWQVYYCLEFSCSRKELFHPVM